MCIRDRTEEDEQRLKDLNASTFYIPATKYAIDIAGTELSTNMALIGAVSGITGCVSLQSLDLALQDRFG